MPKTRLLIIDTEDNIQKIMDVLQKREEDWEVLFVKNPKEAMHVLSSTDIAVVLCGANIPGIKCTSLPYEINKIFEDVNVIILNMNGNEVPREAYLKSSAFDMVQCAEPNLPVETDIIESIEVAVAAKKMRDTGSFKRPVY